MHGLRVMAERLIRLRPAEWRDLAAAQAALLRAQLSVWRRPRGALVTRAVAGQAVAPAAIRLEPAVGALVNAVDRAARYGVLRPQCLVRAIALADLLESRGLGAGRVRVGVRKDGAQLLAHAWVEHGGAVVGEDGHDVSQFAVLSEVKVRR